ncbi:uncharacterized protein LOC133530730 [Cydia pomonella]|uniref:uncharacterized protein LOC133530730 n=1 Tax=Cydia pomonella TaxID=82600 RepID=UPI002ADE6A9C|nr:uncharacterized protein LOC133530730 [Cydia pomonella]
MSKRKCKYINCSNSSDTHSLFKFPVNDKDRLRIWIKNCGNPKLKKLAPELLYNRYVCGDHFDQCYKNTNNQQPRLVKTAIPRHYKGKESNDIESEDESNEIECEKEKSNDIAGENDENKSDSVDPVQATEDVEVVEILCMECDKPIKGFGFQWWCVQCGGLRCGLCALRMVHRPHFLLRSPANTTPEQIQILISAIQKELQLVDFFNSCDTDKYVDQVESADMDLDVIEENLQEPIVKAEPPEEEEDPLAEYSNNSSILKPNSIPTNNYHPKDRQPNSQNCRTNQKYGVDDSLNTHDENFSALGFRETDYQPGEKSLGLVNPFEYQRNLQYLGLEKSLENQASQSSGEDTIDYQPSKESVCLNESTDYQESQTPETLNMLGPENWIDYQPSKKSVCHESSDRSSQTSEGSEFREMFLDFNDFYCNFGLYRYDQPDIDDIRHSASLKTAPKGPDKTPIPDPSSVELAESCSLAADRVPNTDPTSMEFSGSRSFATVRVPNTDPTSIELYGACPSTTDTVLNPNLTGMELSRSGYESDGSYIQLESLVLNDQHLSDEELHPACSKLIRVQTSPDNIDPLINTTIPQAKQIENISQQPVQATEDEPNCTKIIYETKINKTLPPLCIVYSKHQKQAVDNIHQKNYHCRTQQPQIQTQIKQSCTDTIKQTHDHNKEKAVNILGKLKEARNSSMTQQPKIYAAYTKQGLKNTAVPKEKPYKEKSVKNKGGPNNDPLKTKLPRLLVNLTNEDKNCTDTTEKQNNKSETHRPLIKVYSKKQICKNAMEHKDKLKSVNTIENLKNDANTTQESQIKIYSNHETQNFKNDTELNDDNSIIQERQMQVYSTHKKRNCIDSTEQIHVTKTHKDGSTKTNEQNKDLNKMQETQILVYSTHKARNSEHYKTNEQNKDLNKMQETQILVYSTHKARNSEHCRKRKYS